MLEIVSPIGEVSENGRLAIKSFRNPEFGHFVGVSFSPSCREYPSRLAHTHRSRANVYKQKIVV